MFESTKILYRADFGSSEWNGTLNHAKRKKGKEKCKNDVEVAISREEFKDCSSNASKRKSTKALKAILAPIFHDISR